jgi:hypothetical protein
MKRFYPVNLGLIKIHKNHENACVNPQVPLRVVPDGFPEEE